ncbi:MAG TPA: hypothetical protein VFQ53_06915 [Kofleriaceae bacterium]|nr:hypothetical protein [Kofleriaceae bacterium]
MNAERLGSPAQFAVELARHLAAFADVAPRIPSDADIAALVEATFFASLHEEEARRIEFSVAWQPGARDCAAVVAIDRPVRATPKNLTKLAPATWREATSIAIRRDGDELVAWALLESNAAAHQPFTIRVLAAGVLRVDHAGQPRALYARGEMYFLGGAYSVTSPAERLTRAFPAWHGEPADLRAVAIVKIAARALAHGHGGMILVIPSEVATPAGVRVHYGVGDGASVLVTRHADVIRPEAIELVARLTAIDNALLVDTDLRIRGFGVQVIEGDTPAMTFEHVDPYTGDVHTDDLSTFKGTRHPAGVIFCMRQPTVAAAIIASQDGHLSLAVKDARGVVEVLGSYERAFGWR